jgi:histidinol-phosphate aminotransferase
MVSFIRSDLANLHAYNTAHTDSALSQAQTPIALDRLDANENPYDLPAELKQKLAWTWQQMASNRYPDGGHGMLKQLIVDYVNESANGLVNDLANESVTYPIATIAPDQISVGNGSDELIRSILIATCLNGSGSILVADPTFSMYDILAQTLGVNVVHVGRHEADFAIDLEAAQVALGQSYQPPIRVVFVVHPNSPTGNALTTAELDWLRQMPESVLVVIDEAYFEFSQLTVVAELAQRPNWVVLRTFSKAFRLAVHRVGYAIGQPDLIAALEKVRLPYNLPGFSLAAAQLALTHRQDLLAVVPQLLTARTHLIQALRALPHLQVWDSAANFAFVRSSPATAIDLAQLCQQLKAQGTLIRHTGNGLRITVGSMEENQRTIDRLTLALPPA